MSFQYKKNVYRCEKCNTYIVTVDRDQGTTPYITTCKQPNCDGFARSNMYRISQELIPTYEWYIPEMDEQDTLDESTKQHVEMGGLLLRPISSREE